MKNLIEKIAVAYNAFQKDADPQGKPRGCEEVTFL